jgi:hypothetical protein
MPGGISIQIFLPDGSPDGARLVYKSHWTGIAVASPRARYAKLRLDREELHRPGVYVLVGPAEDVRYEMRIYVGESEDPQVRLDSHHANKDFWNRLVMFTSFGQALNKATIRYLEARLLKLAAGAGRAELDNGNVPGLPPLSEPDAADADSFLEDMLVIFPILGVSVFEPLEQTATASRLMLEGPNATAEGAETEDGFVVFAGAQARAAMVESMPEWAANLRHSLVQSGVLVPGNGGATLELTTDHVFSSPSAAAAVLMGRSAAGPLEWKQTSGRTLRQIREQTVASATLSPP